MVQAVNAVKQVSRPSGNKVMPAIDKNPTAPPVPDAARSETLQAAVVLALFFFTGLLFYAWHPMQDGVGPWSLSAFIDAFYFTVVVISTVGYGDLTPTTTTTKAFTCVYF